MTAQEQQRVALLEQVAQGRLSGVEAAALLGVTPRQLRRLRATYQAQGAAGLGHGNRGRQPGHTRPPALRQQVLALARGPYRGCHDQQRSELWAEREGPQLSRSSVRRSLRAAGIASPRRHQAPRHRARRARAPQEGQLLQLAASPHAWLEERGPRCTRFAAIDDATNDVPAALCRATEDAQGSFLLLERVVLAYGRPLAVDRDRHSRPGRPTRRSSDGCRPSAASPRSPPTPPRPRGAWSGCSARCRTAWWPEPADTADQGGHFH